MNRWVPSRSLTEDGDMRRVGIEIELAGMEPGEMSACIRSQFGGKVAEATPLEWVVEDTRFGKFKVELDASYMQELAKKMEVGDDIQEFAMELMTDAAEVLVPWEIVMPPLPMDKLDEAENFVSRLREEGAKGTRHALYYAFGVHLNPELPDLEAQTIVRYLQAYFCLYDWIVSEDDTDFARRVTSYVKHFEKHYIKLVLQSSYRPTINEFIDDYLEYNPTRNRSLDLLPLLATIDKEHIREVVDDPRVKARPTFHFRLPNCDIDNPEWGIWSCWRLWLEVEKLADEPERLAEMCSEYKQEMSRVTHAIEGRWAKRVTRMLEQAKES